MTPTELADEQARTSDVVKRLREYVTLPLIGRGHRGRLIQAAMRDAAAEIEALRAHPVRASAVPSEGRTTALCESNYIAGLMAGWNFGMAEDRDGLNASIKSREGYLAALSPQSASGETSDQPFFDMLWKWFDERGALTHEEARNGLTPEDFKTMLDEHEAAMQSASEPTIAVPDGWKLVPTEPTPDMRVAGGISWSAALPDAVTYVDSADAGYKAMLAAAPTPTTSEPTIGMAAPDAIVTSEYGTTCAAMFFYAAADQDLGEIAEEQGFDVMTVSMEADLGPEHDLSIEYANGSGEVIDTWQPSPPDGWTFGAKHDSEDGPFALFIRRRPVVTSGK